MLMTIRFIFVFFTLMVFWSPIKGLSCTDATGFWVLQAVEGSTG